MKLTYFIAFSGWLLGLVTACDDLFIKIAAWDLEDRDKIGESDPFFTLHIRTNQFYRSCTQVDKHNCDWNEGIKITNGEILRIHYRDHDNAATDDDLGWCEIRIGDLRKLKEGETTRCEIFGEGSGYTIVTRVNYDSGRGCVSGNCFC